MVTFIELITLSLHFIAYDAYSVDCIEVGKGGQWPPIVYRGALLTLKYIILPLTKHYSQYQAFCITRLTDYMTITCNIVLLLTVIKVIIKISTAITYKTH